MLRKAFAVKFEPAHHERYRETALSDTKAILKHWALVGVVALVTLGASIIAAIESNLTTFAKVLLAALGAGVGSLLILGPVVYFASLAAAPHRQRNHARAEVRSLRKAAKEIVPTTALGEAIDLSLMQAEAIKQERSFLSDEDLLKRVRKWKSETTDALSEAKELQKSLLEGPELSTTDDALSFLHEKATLLKDALMHLDRESQQSTYL